MRSHIRALCVSVVCAVMLLGAPYVAIADEDPTPPPTTTTTSAPPLPTTTTPTTETTTVPPEPATTTTTAPQESAQTTQTATPTAEPTETTTSTTTTSPEPEQTTQTTPTPVPQETSAPTTTTTTPVPVIEPTPTSSSAPSSEPLTINVSPTSGPPGTEVTVRGTGWTHQVYADGVEVEISQNYGNGQLTRLTSGKSGPPDAIGVFSLKMTIPATAKPGLLSISPITGGPEISDAPFTVTGGGGPSGQEQTQPTVTLTPTDGPPGTVTTADGHGFTPNQPVTVTQSGGPQITGGGGTVQADHSGSIKMSFRIADQTPPGVITATFTQGPKTATAQFQVTARQPGQGNGETSSGFPNTSGGQGGPGQPGQGNTGGPGQDTQPQPGQQPNANQGGNPEESDIFAGWSAYTGQPLRDAWGAWEVPAIECNAPLGSPALVQSRVSPWVGMWGKDAFADKTWLPQIGTVSICHGGQLRYNKAVWQLYTNGDPGPNELFDVRPGDQMIASIHYLGKQPDGTLKFRLHIDDVTQHVSQDKDVSTRPGVAEDDAVWQGGCILEREPDVNGQLLPSPSWPYGGLPKFTTPFSFTQCAVNDQWINTFPSRIKWSMQRASTVFATTGELSGSGAFQVNWNAWH
jgi:hypothetical protein